MKKLLLSMFWISLVCLLMGQTYHIQEGFSTTSLPSGWSGDVYFNSTANIGNLSGGNGAGFNATNKYLQIPAVNGAGIPIRGRQFWRITIICRPRSPL